MSQKEAINQNYLNLSYHYTVLITSFFILIANFIGNAWGADVYIDPTYRGIELGTFEKPYNSWHDIISFSASDDYRQKCGTSETLHDILVIKATGASDNYIIIGAYNADGSYEDGANETFGEHCSGGLEKPILRRAVNGTSTIAATAEGGKQYLHINSIKFIEAEIAVVVKSNYNKIRNCYVHNTEWGFRVGTPNSRSIDGDYNLIEYNYLDMNDAVNGVHPQGDAIDLRSRAQHNTVQYNWVSGFDHAGIFLSGGDYNTIQYNYIFEASSTEQECIAHNINGDFNIIRYNYCNNAGTGHHIMGGNYNEIYGNTYSCNGPIRPTHSQGCIQFQSEVNSITSSNNKFYNNTIYDNYNVAYGVGIYFYSGDSDSADMSGNKIHNNVILKVSGYCIRTYDSNNVIGTNYFYNNSCFDYNTNQFANIEGSISTTATAFNARAYAANNRDDDPGLKNLAVEHFWPDDANDNVVGNGYNLGLNYNQILDPDATAFTASPPKVKTKTQPINWIIGSYALPGGSPLVPPPIDLKIFPTP